MNFLQHLIHKVLVPRKEPETKLACFSEDRTVTVDSAESVFSRNGEIIALYKVKPATITIRSTTKNPNRIILYRSTGQNGLRVFYYRDNISRFHVSCGDSIVTIQRDDIPALRAAIRRFTQNAKPNTTRKPGRPFSEYEAPP